MRNIILISLVLLGCTKIERFLEKNPDNLVEEMVEDVIEDTLGIEVDFTPESDQIQDEASLRHSE